MLSINVAESIQRYHFEPSFEMLVEIISTCPDELWGNGKQNHHPIWQHIYHALAGSWIWFRPAGRPFQEPPLGEGIAELKVYPQQNQTKQQVLAFAVEAKARAVAFFAMAKEGQNLTAAYSFYDKISNLDVIMMQIRHIQHHVGYCNSILAEHNAAVPWKEVLE